MRFKYEHETNPPTLTLMFLDDDEIVVGLALLEKVAECYPPEQRDGILLNIARIEQLRRAQYDS